MARLDKLTRRTTVKKVLPDSPATVVHVNWHGSSVVEHTCKGSAAWLDNELVHPDSEPSIEIVKAGRHWLFTAAGSMLPPVDPSEYIQYLPHAMLPISYLSPP